CGRGAGGSASGAAAPGLARARCSTTSAFVRRPPFPVAGMRSGSSRCSATRCRTAGLSGGPPPAGGAGRGASGARAGSEGGAAAAGSGRAGAGRGAAGRAAASSSVATTSPTCTVAPSGFTMWRTPPRSAGISMFALSVSSSSSTSSGATASPSAFRQRVIVPSVTDSPSVGIRTSNAIRPASSALARECAVQKLPLFLQVELVRPRRRARRLRAPDVSERPAGGQDPAEARRDEMPRAHVPGLLLHPEDLRRLRITREDRRQRLAGERVELLDAHDRGRLEGALTALGEERVVDLPAAEEEAPDARRVDDDARLGGPRDGRVVEHDLERAVGEVPERRHRGPVAEQALRGHDDERLAELAVHLAAEEVEVLGGGGRVADLDVVLGAELEPALEPRARVLRPLPLVAVREQHDEPAHPLPLRLRARDELVDDHLRAVREVAELRLPHDELPRVGEAHAELE